MKYFGDYLTSIVIYVKVKNIGVTSLIRIEWLICELQTHNNVHITIILKRKTSNNSSN